MTFFTNFSPGAAAFGDSVMAVATKIDKSGRGISDGSIFYNWWNYGGGGHGWIELEGGGRTNAAPAASFVRRGDIGTELDMFAVIKGLDNNVYTNTGGGFGNPFNRWVLLPGLQTNVAPAAAVANSLLPVVGANEPIVVATDTAGRISYNRRDGSGWREPDGDGRTDAAPAAAVVDGDYAEIAIKGLSDGSGVGGLFLNQGHLGASFTGWESMNFQTRVAPALTSSGNTIAIVAAAPDGSVFYDYWGLGEGGHGFQSVGAEGGTNAALAAALVRDALYILAKGLDGNLYLKQGTLGGSFTEWALM
jgi:hypothetical protein